MEWRLIVLKTCTSCPAPCLQMSPEHFTVATDTRKGVFIYVLFSIPICCLERVFSFHFLHLDFHTCLFSCCQKRVFSLLIPCFSYLSVAWKGCFHFKYLVFHTCLLSGKSVFISYVLFSIPVCCQKKKKIIAYVLFSTPFCCLETTVWKECFNFLCLVVSTCLSVARKVCFDLFCRVFHTFLFEKGVFIFYALFSLPVCVLP